MTKTFLVSGAGTGIGQAICTQLQATHPSATFVLMGRNMERLEATKKLLNPKNDHAIVSVDTRDGEAMRKEFTRVGLEHRNLTGVIANAGVGGANSYGTTDRWNEVIDTNLKGAYVLFNEALPALRASTHVYKHVLLVSSILARLGVPGYAAYCASKAGILGLTRSLAVEFARENILVNAVCPGWVETDMARSGIDAISKVTGKSYDECQAGDESGATWKDEPTRRNRAICRLSDVGRAEIDHRPVIRRQQWGINALISHSAA